MSVRRIGILGGTFDPPHIGHLVLASEAQAQLGLEQVLWVLTPFPPHKQDQLITPLPQRLEMLNAALDENPAFSLSRVDIDRQPPHYALDTVRLLQASHRGTDLIYLMGGDSLSNLPTWYHALEFVQACAGIGVMHRTGIRIDLDHVETVLPGISEKVLFINTPWLEISSSDIRQRVSDGLPYRYFLPAPVYQMVNRYGLYQQE